MAKTDKKACREMIREDNPHQLSIEEFRTPFYRGLDKTNRWVRLAQVLPWAEMIEIYTQSLNKGFGRPAIPTRVVVGALIIKHKQRLSDEETIAAIQENPYLQYFIGYEEFSHKRPFDPSLFVTIRKRLGEEGLNRMNERFLSMIKVAEREGAGQRRGKGGKQAKPPDSAGQLSEKEKDEMPKEVTHRGVLLVDATVAPADIRYPTDLELLNASREHSERLIDLLYEPGSEMVKPRTYRRNARREYLSLAKKRRKSGKEIRKGVRKQLNYLRRNLRIINELLDGYKGRKVPFEKKDFKTLWVITEIYRQQRQMYEEGSHRIENRIVSLSQPHVRPIIRGKAGSEVEFGAKLSASVIDGYAFLDRISWEAYNESGDLPSQVEGYRERFGYYPEVVVTDQLYGTRANRRYLKERGIRYSGKPLGRRPKGAGIDQANLKAERRRRRYESGLRNHIEGKFGEGKRAYDLGLVKAKTARTSEAWISAVFFVMNLARWLRVYFLPYFQRLFRRFWRTILLSKKQFLVPSWG